MDLKSIIYAALAAILPIVYSLIVGELPSFPLESADFVGLILWVIGLLVGGWNLKAGRIKYLQKK